VTWTRLPGLSVSTLRSGCLCCGSREALLAPDALIAVGFGYAAVTCNGEEIWSENRNMPNATSNDDYWTCRIAERFARSDPDYDWRIVLQGALSDATYQRHGIGRWVLVHQGRGFTADDEDDVPFGDAPAPAPGPA